MVACVSNKKSDSYSGFSALFVVTVWIRQLNASNKTDAHGVRSRLFTKIRLCINNNFSFVGVNDLTHTPLTISST